MGRESNGMDFSKLPYEYQIWTEHIALVFLLIITAHMMLVSQLREVML